MKIAVDIGFGFTKVKTADGICKKFPSVLGEKETKNADINFGQKDDYEVTIEIGGVSKSYYVGELAITNLCYRSWSSDHSMDKEQIKVLALLACAIVSSDEEEIELLLGLPVSFHKKFRSTVETIFNGLEATVKLADGNEKRIFVKKVQIGIQGVGAFFSLLKQKRLDTSTAVIDVGYRTVDYIAINRGLKGMNFMSQFSGTLEDVGMSTVFTRLEGLLKQEGINKNSNEIERAITHNNGVIETKNGLKDITEQVKDGYAMLARKIASEINLVWEGYAEVVPTIYVTGGGGEAIFESLKEYFPQAELQEDSVFANCDGYLKSM